MCATIATMFAECDERDERIYSAVYLRIYSTAETS
jgi:hypothetical protein